MSAIDRQVAGIVNDITRCMGVDSSNGSIECHERNTCERYLQLGRDRLTNARVSIMSMLPASPIGCEFRIERVTE